MGGWGVGGMSLHYQERGNSTAILWRDSQVLRPCAAKSRPHDLGFALGLQNQNKSKGIESRFQLCFGVTADNGFIFWDRQRGPREL